MQRRAFYQLVTILVATIFLTPLNSSFARAEVPDNIRRCIEQRAQTIANIQHFETGLRKFKEYAALDLIGRIAFRGGWRGFSKVEKSITYQHFFSYLYKARRTSGTLEIHQIEIESRELPDHAFEGLVHVHVRITFTDQSVTRFNLLGTQDCQLVDAGRGKSWITRQLDAGIIERQAQR